MALTAARVGDPFTLGPFAAAFISVTFDAAYPSGGEPLTAAMAGMRSLVAVIPVGGARASAASVYPMRTAVEAGNLSALLQIFVSGGTAGYIQNEPLVEETTVGQSATTALLLVLGYA